MVNRMFLTLCLVLASSQLSDAVFSDDYNMWIADLMPGWEIETYETATERCHCKVPLITSSSSVMESSSSEATTTAATTTTPTPTTTTPTTTPAAITTSAAISIGGIPCVNTTVELTGTPMTYTWKTPNYPGKYDDDVCIVLTVIVPDTVPNYHLVYEFQGLDDLINPGTQCPHDYISQERETTTFGIYAHRPPVRHCGSGAIINLEEASGFGNTHLEDTLVFMASSQDGNIVAKGFELLISLTAMW